MLRRISSTPGPPSPSHWIITYTTLYTYLSDYQDSPTSVCKGLHTRRHCLTCQAVACQLCLCMALLNDWNRSAITAVAVMFSLKPGDGMNNHIPCFLPHCSMQGGLSDRNGVCPSVRLSVRLSVTAWIVTKRTKIPPRFLCHMKGNLHTLSDT